jgi:hypothetical protein
LNNLEFIKAFVISKFLNQLQTIIETGSEDKGLRLFQVEEQNEDPELS